MTVSRFVKESPLLQGKDEQIVYSLTTTPWGSSPSSVSVKIFKESDGSDVSSTCLAGSASVVGDVITLPKVQALTAGEKYRLEVQFTTAGNVLEAILLIYAEK